jgi:putative oxidoreductase
MTTTEKFTELAGRLLIAAMFLVAGIGKIAGYAATQGYMQSQGVPGVLLPLVIALEVLGAMAIIVAALLAVFTIVAAVIFHGGDDRMQQILFLKNVSIAGGFLLLVARGAGAWSIDARRNERTKPGELLRHS